MPTVRMEGGGPHQERTIREEQRLALRRQAATSLLTVLKGDGPNAKAKIAEIKNSLGYASPEYWPEKVPIWRRELRVARYQDWKASRT